MKKRPNGTISPCRKPMKKSPFGPIVHVESLWKKSQLAYYPCRKPMEKKPFRPSLSKLYIWRKGE
jgi:hypothetical protein